MTTPESTTRSVIVEKEFPQPPEKVWRALTEKSLIEQWLMKNDFQPVVGHSFNLRADWGAVDCQVLAVDPNKQNLSNVGRPIRLADAGAEPWPGAPLEPTGDPMLAGVGPGSYAERADHPEKTYHGDDLLAPPPASATS